MEPSKNQLTPQPVKKKVPMYLIAILITLSVLFIITVVLLIQKSQDYMQAKDDIVLVEEQRVELEGELNNLIVGYDSLRTENDSINLQLNTEQEKIKRLLRVQASNSTKIRMYKKELETLRRVMRSYIIQIDSLNTRNRELTAENVEVRTQLRQVSKEKDELHSEKEELSTKVEEAQILSAKNVVAVGLNERSREKDKISKIIRLRTCFTVRENKVADAGTKMVYMRIFRPDDVVLSSPDADYFEFNGEQVIYSAKRELEYDNADIDMCIYWDKTEELIEGSYTVVLYCEGAEIGAGTLHLK